MKNNYLKSLMKKSTHRLVLFISLFTPTLYAGSLSPYSNKELYELEKEFIQLINQSDQVERNPLASQYINQLGTKLALYGGIKSPYFFIVKSREINAFAGPGGYIGVNTQLILTSSNESELAAVMAHEIAHVRLHHLYSMIEHQREMRIPMVASMLASIALGVLNPSAGMGAMMASYTGFAQNSINYTRSKEKEADRIGIDMLIKAGFNPKGMAAFFKKMQENNRYHYTANIPAILLTHPLDDDRIAEAENRTARLGARNVPNSMEYSLFKELIRTSVALDNTQLFNFYLHQCSKENTALACEYGQALTLIRNNQWQKAFDKLQTLNHFGANAKEDLRTSIPSSALRAPSPHTWGEGNNEKSSLRTLNTNNANNLYVQIATAQAEIGLNKFPQALTRLETLQTNFPDNYAALMAYANGLMAANQASKATGILLKGSRQFKQDLPLCRELARAQAQAHQKSYAYFTQAQCLLLEGQKRSAIAQLRVARKLAQKDSYLLARIEAKIEEIKS